MVRTTRARRAARRSADHPVTTALGSLVLCLALVAGSAAAAGAGQTPAVATGSRSGLSLLAQSSTVSGGQSFDLKLGVARATVPAGQLGLSIAVFGCLASVSAFDQSVSSTGPVGTPVTATSTPVPVATLPGLTGGGVDLNLPVRIGDDPAIDTSDGLTVDLPAAGGQCQGTSGVYPVRVQLVDTTSSQVLGTIDTHLIYTPSTTDTQRLRVALILPVATTVGPADDPTAAELGRRPSSALATPSPASLDAAAGVVTGVVDHPTVPVTLVASPQTLVALADSGHPTTGTQLSSLASLPTVHQLASPSYVPVDASALVASGLSSELSLQVTRGAQVLGSEVARPHGSLGSWFTNDGVSSAALAQLQADGYDQLVLPSSQVASEPTNGSTAEPFPLTTSHGNLVTVVGADTDLSARFTESPGSQVLAAHQLLAELAQMYFEKPNDDTPRGVVALAPTGWTGSQSFVDTLLGALTDNPIVEPVTTTGLFSTLTTGSCRGGCRLTNPGTGSSLPATSIRTERQRTSGFAAAAPSAHQISAQLGDLVLSAEAQALGPAQQSRVLRNTGAALDAQLDQLLVAGDQTVTLTSQRGRIPVTVVSSATYPVLATLTLTSDKLLFANGTTRWSTSTTLLPHHNNVVYVSVQTRASGQFKVDVAVDSPSGDLALAVGEISVRSTASSVVGVVLSVGAIVVLMAWWIRTSRKRRALRRHDDEAELRDPDPVGP